MCTDCHKIYRKSVLHLQMYRFAVNFGTKMLNTQYAYSFYRRRMINFLHSFFLSLCPKWPEYYLHVTQIRNINSRSMINISISFDMYLLNLPKLGCSPRIHFLWFQQNRLVSRDYSTYIPSSFLIRYSLLWTGLSLMVCTVQLYYNSM